MDELTHLVKQERVTKEEWATRFKVNESTLSNRTQKILSLEQQLQVVLIDKDQLNLTIEKMNNTLKIERQEREEFESQAHENLHQFQMKEKELHDLVQISRQLEKQRYNQYRKADKDIAAPEHKILTTAEQTEFTIANFEGLILRLDGRHRNLEAKRLAEQEAYEEKLKQKQAELKEKQRKAEQREKQKQAELKEKQRRAELKEKERLEKLKKEAELKKQAELKEKQRLKDLEKAKKEAAKKEKQRQEELREKEKQAALKKQAELKEKQRLAEQKK